MPSVRTLVTLLIISTYSLPMYIRGSSFFLGKVTALGVLCCFALFVCLTLLASSFLPSHLSFKYMYKHVCRTHCRLATNTARNHPILPTVSDWIPAHCTSDRLCWTPSNVYTLATEVLSKTEGGGELKYGI